MSDRPLDAPPAVEDDLPEQLRVRRQKRARMLAEGREPYPVQVPRTHTLRQIRERFGDAGLAPDTSTGEQVAVTGRAIFLRDTGKLCFLRLRAGDGTELQAMLSLAEIGEESLADFKALVDLGDHVAVQGEVVTSRRGELSVQASGWQLAAKTLRPLPVEHRPLSEELRVRLRYADLIVRPEARDMVRMRATVLRSLRETLQRRDYTEVETPILQYVHGGAPARPFHTHINAYDEDMSLRIAIELFLKRCVVGGIDRVYEIGRVFRNEGLDTSHSPEFTMLEAYEAYGDYTSMARLTRDLVLDAARAVGRTVVPDGRGGEIDLEGEWRELTVLDAVSGAVGSEVTVQTSVEELRRHADRAGVELQAQWDAGQVLVQLYEKLVEPTLVQPTFVKDYPESAKPLARQHRSQPGLVEAWDLVIAGVELAPAYSELADPVLQRQRLTEQSLLAVSGDPEAMLLDEDFLRALEFGFPPTGGMGMGVDRLLRLFAGVGIRETILFPLARPE
ncbi:MAG TPA: lysine--tRNA ligase [Nocardioidaceae bacterium]|nr:lysine--tRNA ligase [Nocardioidaceae bacterium]